MVELLLSAKLSRNKVKSVLQAEKIYIPLVYQQEFNPKEFYWNKYRNEVVGHCLKVFNEVQQFQVQYEGQQHEINPLFLDEVKKISEFMKFDLLEGKKFDKNGTD